MFQTNPPGISNDKLKRANARYKSIRTHSAHFAPEAAAGRRPSFAPEATTAATTCPQTSIWRLYEFNGALAHPRAGGVYV